MRVWKYLWISFTVLVVWGCVRSKGPVFEDGRIYLIVDVDPKLVEYERCIEVVTEVEGYEPIRLYIIDQSMLEHPYYGEKYRLHNINKANTLDMTTVRGKRIEITRRFLPDGSLSDGILVPGGTEVTVTVKVSPWAHTQVLTESFRVDGDAIFRLYPAGEHYNPRFELTRIL